MITTCFVTFKKPQTVQKPNLTGKGTQKEYVWDFPRTKPNAKPVKASKITWSAWG